VGADPTDDRYYYMRYPRLNELLYREGREGVSYCLVAGYNIKKFENDFIINAKGEKIYWSLVEGTRTYTIEGPNGVVDSVVLMGRGAPIPGSDDYNGVRPYYVDADVEEQTGLPSDPSNPESLPTKETADASNTGKKQAGDQREHKATA